MSLTDHPSGGYRFLPGIAPYSRGVIAAPGYEIVQVTFQDPLPYGQGFQEAHRILEAESRPPTALCAVSLRSPHPFTFAGFAAFNAEYACVLRDWGVFVDDVNPIARTNVAPCVEPPPEPALYGFSFTRERAELGTPTFVVAGAGELPEGSLQAEDIVARSELSQSGLRRKAEFVMDLMAARLKGLGVSWKSLTMVNIYSQHPLQPLLENTILDRLHGSAIHGVHWHYSQPPIKEIEFEMDMRSVRTEWRV